MQEKTQAQDLSDASIIRVSGLSEQANAQGVFSAQCFDKDGNLKWEDNFPNIVTITGRNLALDAFLAGSAYTVTGPYLGLISSISYTGTSNGDTMSVHAGWVEAGGANAPIYSGGRKLAVWSAASSASKSFSAPLASTMGGTGTIKGCFLVYGSGAVSTIDNTAGTLYSAGLFAGGDKIVSIFDVVNVSYTASM